MHMTDKLGDRASKQWCCGFSGMSHSLFLPDFRATERQALGSHGKAFFPECPEAPEPLGNRWWISKEGRKQVLTESVSWTRGHSRVGRPQVACDSD